MILVDIFVPSVDKTYDFQLNETISVNMIIEEIAEIISQKEQTKLVGDVCQLQLCDCLKQRPLQKTWTLEECEIVTGSRLILI